jgi:hypothetical protein
MKLWIPCSWDDHLCQATISWCPLSMLGCTPSRELKRRVSLGGWWRLSPGRDPYHRGPSRWEVWKTAELRKMTLYLKIMYFCENSMKYHVRWISKNLFKEEHIFQYIPIYIYIIYPFFCYNSAADKCPKKDMKISAWLHLQDATKDARLALNPFVVGAWESGASLTMPKWESWVTRSYWY